MSLLSGLGGGSIGVGLGDGPKAENTAGSGSGLKKAKTWNFGFMAGVRQLRDEEYEDQYKPSLKPPGSHNYAEIARQQFDYEMAGGSGYMAEEPGNTPAWRRVPEHVKKLRLPGLLYDGTALDDPNDSYENGIAGQWSSKMRKHGQVGKHILPGYDGAVLGPAEEAKEEENAVPKLGEPDTKERRAEKVQQMLEKRSARSARSAGSDPRSFLSEAKASGVLDGNPAQSAGWETGSANANRLASLKQMLVGWQEKTKASKSRKA
jgi:hypothetical protein